MFLSRQLQHLPTTQAALRSTTLHYRAIYGQALEPDLHFLSDALIAILKGMDRRQAA